MREGGREGGRERGKSRGSSYLRLELLEDVSPRTLLLGIPLRLGQKLLVAARDLEGGKTRKKSETVSKMLITCHKPVLPPSLPRPLPPSLPYLGVQAELANLRSNVPQLPLQLVATLDVRDVAALEGDLLVVQL